MKTDKATTRPWKLGDITQVTDIEDSSGELVCSVESAKNIHEESANAELIVRAVNCHDELIKRFESLIEDQENYLRRITDQDDGDYYTKKSELEKDRKLLKRAKGEL